MDLDQIDIEELTGARELFEAYCVGVGGIAFNGDKIPGWHDITDKVRYGWVCAYRRALEIAPRNCISFTAVCSGDLNITDIRM